MKLENALNRLEKAGYQIATNGSAYSAYLDGHEITFTAHDNKTSNFSSGIPSACAITFGMTLKKAMN